MQAKHLHFKLVIIGAGNVATHLAKRLKKKGCEIMQIVSRSTKNAQALSLQLSVPFVTDIKKINKQADIYILCTSDDEIEKISKILKLPGKLVLHTSGSVDRNILKNISSNVGVLYPLQSFSKEVKTSFTSVPLLIEASNKQSLQKLKIVATLISKQVREVNSVNRLKLHVAATMINNFTNHIYTLSHEFLIKEKNDLFHLLMPMMKESFNKLKKQRPIALQTGPAKRGDEKTIKKHLQMLEKYPEQKKVYELFTALIKKKYNAHL
ncbi:MAG: Rossmann-like and DUF2520 domain-containing protein [Bacteroidia bacterium]